MEQLRQWDRTALWHAFTQMAEYEPFIVAEAQGATLVDIDGRTYLDGVSSLWCNLHGHRHPRLDAAVRRQLDQIAHFTLLGSSTPPAVELAHRLTEVSPGRLPHVFFSSDGSSAVEVAIKMAFQYWRQCDTPRPEKTQFVALESAYHGDTIGSVSVGGVARFHEMFGPLLYPVQRAPSPDLYRLPPEIDPAAACDYYLQQAEAVLREHHERLAAMVVEPLVQCAAGMVVHPRGYLAGVRELTRRYDVLLIVDEVATGFGRTGTLFACEQEQVAPDLLCLGKGLTAGYLPMAATLASQRVWEAFLGAYADSRHFYHGHTYSGNALAAAVALASLDVFEDQAVLASLPPKIQQLSDRLQQVARLPYVGDVRQVGLIGAVELSPYPELKAPFPWQERRGERVCQYAKSQGVHLRPLGSVLVIMPPLCIQPAELDQIMDAVEGGIQHATADLYDSGGWISV